MHKDPEKRREYSKAYREKNKEKIKLERKNNAARYREYCKNFRQSEKGKAYNSSPERQEYLKNYNEQNKEKIAEYRSNYYQENREVIREKDRARRLTDERIAYNASPERKESVRNYKQKSRDTNKLSVMSVYSSGDLCCKTCGFSDMRALSIDHIDGGGRAQREENGIERAGGNLYAWLVRNAYPDGFQVLCMNCQHLKRHDRMEGWSSPVPNFIPYNVLHTKILRFDTIAYYTGNQFACTRCSYKGYPALCLDHVNDDGAAQRKIHGTGLTFYKWIKKNQYPDTLQVLCQNCNFIKQYEYSHK